MRRTITFVISGLLVVGLAAPAWAADSQQGAQPDPAGRNVSLSELSAVDPLSSGYEVNRHDRDRYRDGRWYGDRDGRWYYRDGRWYYRDGRYYYRDGRWYYDDGRYRHEHPYYRGGPTRHCHDGEWRYHPRAGWRCV